MIRLIPTATDEEVQEGIEAFKAMSVFQKNEFEQSINMLETAPLSDNLVVMVGTAVTDEGIRYDNLEFIVTARYKRIGFVYLSNGVFELDYTALKRYIAKITAE